MGSHDLGGTADADDQEFLDNLDNLESMDDFWAVIPAGGAGTRLWPLSRSGYPKFLLDLTGTGRTLLQKTVDRLAPVAGSRFLVVTGVAHREAVLAQLDSLTDDDVFAEPSARDSMAAIGLAAAVLERRDPDAVMGSFAADHVIRDEAGFRRCVQDAAATAREGWLVTIGIWPTYPSTGFGYIRAGESLGAAARVLEFVEKPGPQLAAEYVDAGYWWNAGMFVCRPGVLLDLLAQSDQEFAAALRAIAANPASTAEVWGSLPKISIDHAVAEPAAAAGRVAVVPGDFGWDDIGDFASLSDLLEVPADGEAGPKILGDSSRVVAKDATGLVVPAAGRTVTVLGLDDIVVVDTPDALLVTTRDRAQDVKSLVDVLKASGRTDLT